MTALLEPTERYPHKLRVSYEGGKPVRAVIEGIEFAPSAPQEPDDDALEQIAAFLVEQRGEPWPGGTDATRLHYWRDKAIEGARRLRALQAKAPETGEE